jgi:hypothetical protein
MLGGAYALSVISAQPSSNNGTGWLYMPVFGPWITMAECSGCTDSHYSLLALDGLVQSAGTALIILGVTLTKKTYKRRYNRFGMMVLPRRFSENGYGVSVSGRF